MLKSSATGDGTGSISLAMKNYGPISRGSVVLKPLTILVGPNGCGKTHVVKLLHSVLKAEGRHINWNLKSMRSLQDKKANWHLHDESPSSILRNEAKRIYSRIQEGGTVDSDIYKHVAAVWSKSLESEIMNNFPGSFYNMIRIGSGYFELDIASETNRGKFMHGMNADNKFETAEIDNINLEIEFKKYSDVSEMDADKKPYRNKETIHVNVPAICDERTIFNALKDGVTAEKSTLKRNIYFPAERSGLTLLSDAMPRPIGRRKGRPNKPAGTVADLFSWMSDMDGQRGAFAHMAEDFEVNALGGKVVLRTNIRMPPFISYILGKRTFSMDEASSSVRDVALFLVYLKHTAKIGDMVILEEPEINLHPDNQLLLARLIARLAAAGLCMVVSTHSPYFLEQMSHCVVGGSILNEESGKVLPHDECLRISDVAAYRFVPHDGNYEICPLDIAEDGIPQTEFTDVDEKLYSELTMLRQADEQ